MDCDQTDCCGTVTIDRALNCWLKPHRLNKGRGLTQQNREAVMHSSNRRSHSFRVVVKLLVAHDDECCLTLCLFPFLINNDAVRLFLETSRSYRQFVK
jgi:hypothetical protein